MADSDLELDDDQSLSKSHSKLLENVSALDIKQRYVQFFRLYSF